MAPWARPGSRPAPAARGAVRRSAPAAVLRVAAAAVLAACAARAVLGPVEAPAHDARAFAAEPAARAGGLRDGRRQQLLAAAVASGLGAAGAEPARAVQSDEKKDETLRIPTNPRSGTMSYLFEKPKGFRRFANPGDPSGFVFRAIDDTYFTFVTRAEKREGDPFTPEAFIEDYRNKFVNATGSSFELISSTMDREDPGLGIKYWQVEYVVRTQLGFSFDSLKSLHFITTFAAAKDSLYILNSQSLDDKWDVNGPVLSKVAKSFQVTG